MSVPSNDGDYSSSVRSAPVSSRNALHVVVKVGNTGDDYFEIVCTPNPRLYDLVRQYANTRMSTGTKQWIIIPTEDVASTRDYPELLHLLVRHANTMEHCARADLSPAEYRQWAAGVVRGTTTEHASPVLQVIASVISGADNNIGVDLFMKFVRHFNAATLCTIVSAPIFRSVHVRCDAISRLSPRADDDEYNNAPNRLLRAISGNSSVRSVDIDWHWSKTAQGSPDCLARFVANAPHVRHLSVVFQNNTPVLQRLMDAFAIGMNTTITHLRVVVTTGVRDDPYMARLLAHAPSSIRSIKISICYVISRHDLDLVAGEMSNDRRGEELICPRVADIAAALARSRVLESFDITISSMFFQASGASLAMRMFADAVRTHPSLRHFRLFCELDQPVPMESYDVFIPVVTDNRHLEWLDVGVEASVADERRTKGRLIDTYESTLAARKGVMKLQGITTLPGAFILMDSRRRQYDIGQSFAQLLFADSVATRHFSDDHVHVPTDGNNVDDEMNDITGALIHMGVGGQWRRGPASAAIRGVDGDGDESMNDVTSAISDMHVGEQDRYVAAGPASGSSNALSRAFEDPRMNREKILSIVGALLDVRGSSFDVHRTEYNGVRHKRDSDARDSSARAPKRDR